MVNSGDETYKAASYKLTADVDYMNYEWTPIGLSGFSGKFSGNGHVVKNIKITTNNNLNGFFGDVSGGAVISNLGLENMTMDLRDGYWTGGFACRNYGTFENCYIANSTLKNTGGWAMGAFVGASANAGTYRNCYVYNVALNGKTEVSNFAGTVEGYSYFYTCYTAGVTSTNATTVYNLTNNPKAKPVTVDQCYSDVATTGTNAPVDATVADKAGIQSGLVAFDANCAYKVNSKINNGYPCMSYQKAAAYDNEYEVAMFTDADGIKVRIEENEAVADAVVYVATYDNDGRLIAAEALDVDTIVTSTLSTAGVKTIKVFVWDASNNSLALAKVINK